MKSNLYEWVTMSALDKALRVKIRKEKIKKLFPDSIVKSKNPSK